MATAVGLNMKITADTAGIGRGISKTEQMLGGLSKSASSAAGSLKALVAIDVGTKLAAAFASAARSAVNYANGLRSVIDETAKVAQRTGVAVEALQSLQVAADLAGVGNFEGVIQKFTVAIAKASEGGEEARKAFTKIGLSFEELETLSPEDQFRKVSAAIAAIPSAAGRAAAATEIFGKAGLELLPLFASNIAEVEARAKRLGIVLGEDQTASIESMNDALGLVQKTFDGIIGQVTSNLAPIVTDLVEEFLSFVEAFEGGSGGGSGIADVITNGLLDFAEYLAGVFDSAVEQFEGFGATMETVSDIFETSSNVFLAVAEALRGVFNIFEIAGNGIALALGKAIEYFGGFFSRDAAEFGRIMAETASKSLDKNIKEADQAFANAGKSAAAAIFGTDPASRQRGQGAASQAVQGARERFNNRNSPEAQAERLAKQQEALLGRLTASFEKTSATAESVFGDNVPAAVAEAADRVKQLITEAMEDGFISEEEAKQIAAAQAEYNTALKEGAEALKEAEEAERKRAAAIERINEKILAAEENRAQRAAEIEADRLENLAKASTDALNVSDVRSGGINDILRIAAGREDPAIEEYRKQLSELRKIDNKLAALAAEKVEIIGGGRGRAA